MKYTGGDPTVPPWGPPEVLVVRLLTSAKPDDQIAAEASRHYRRAPRFSAEDVSEILRAAAEMVRSEHLLPPAAAAYIERAGAGSSDIDLPRVMSVELLEAYASDAQPREPARSGTPQWNALMYAESVLQQLWWRQTRESSDLRADLETGDQMPVDEYLLYWSVRAGPKSLERWLLRWQAATRGIERHPETGLHEELWDALTVRDRLAEVGTLVSQASRQALSVHIDPIDARFREATRSVTSSILPPDPWASQGWWWFRVPSPPGDSFVQRLWDVAPDVAAELAPRS